MKPRHLRTNYSGLTLRELHARWQARKLAEGLCNRCGSNPHRPGLKSCQECMDFAREKRLALQTV